MVQPFLALNLFASSGRYDGHAYMQANADETDEFFIQSAKLYAYMT